MGYFISILVLLGIYVILSVSFNIIIGYAGLVSIAHPVFFGIGAYASGLLSKSGTLAIPVAMAAAVLLVAAISSIMAVASLRVSGDYLLIASLAFQLALIAVLNNITITGGPSGLSGIRPLFSGIHRDVEMALLVWIVAIAVVVLAWLTIRSPYGRAIRALRDDEMAYESLGRNARGMKTVVMVVGSALAGLAGAFYGHYYQYISPEQLGVTASALLLTIVVVGGMGTTLGPVLGSFIVILFPQALLYANLPPSVSSSVQGLIFTGVVILFLFFRPEGLLPDKSRDGLSGRRASSLEGNAREPLADEKVEL